MKQVTKSGELGNLLEGLNKNILPISMRLKNATFWDIKDDINNPNEKIIKLAIYGITILKGIYDIKSKKIVFDNEDSYDFDSLKFQIINLFNQ